MRLLWVNPSRQLRPHSRLLTPCLPAPAGQGNRKGRVKAILLILWIKIKIV